MSCEDDTVSKNQDNKSLESLIVPSFLEWLSSTNNKQDAVVKEDITARFPEWTLKFTNCRVRHPDKRREDRDWAKETFDDAQEMGYLFFCYVGRLRERKSAINNRRYFEKDREERDVANSCCSFAWKGRGKVNIFLSKRKRVYLPLFFKVYGTIYGLRKQYIRTLFFLRE
jgi:hypothetical protein